jgi:putative alpha-1,2-mannosidase
MVQFAPESVDGGPGGYTFGDRALTGFSVTRLSGAGCTNYGDVPLMPITKPVGASPGRGAWRYAASFEHWNERARPGQYDVRLDSGVGVAP